MPRIAARTVFKFDELDDKAKEVARNWWRECENSDFDPSTIIDEAARFADLLGIHLHLRSGLKDPKIWWSGFSSQGDGACFEGAYSWSAKSELEYRAALAEDTEIHRIAGELAEVQRRNNFEVTAYITHRGRGYNSSCMDINVGLGEDYENETNPVGDIEAVQQLMRDFADWIYKQLETEYDWRMSDEQVDESIRCNEYEFEGNGDRA